MLNLKYIGSEEKYQVSFKLNNNNLVTITGDVPVKKTGFKMYLPNSNDVLGDYSDFVTVYKELDNGVMYSNDGSVYVEPEIVTSFSTTVGGSLDGAVSQVVDDYSELIIPTPIADENYEFVGWNPEIPESGEIANNTSFVAEFVYIPTEEEIADMLEEAKVAKIVESKIMLEEYLTSHPLVSTCHGGTEAYYNVTTEKQSLMASNYLTYTIKKESGLDAVLTWNATGKECEEWTEAEFIQLVLEVDAYVKPLVALQQSYEVQIMECVTQEELDAIEIVYGA